MWAYEIHNGHFDVKNSISYVNIPLIPSPVWLSTQSNSPTTMATRQVDIMGVLSKVTVFISPSSTLFTCTTKYIIIQCPLVSWLYFFQYFSVQIKTLKPEFELPYAHPVFEIRENKWVLSFPKKILSKFHSLTVFKTYLQYQ